MSGTIIVTGSGRGIGAATALLAAKRGYAVCVNYANRSEDADKVVEAIRKEGGKAIAVKADVSKEAEVKAMFDTAVAELGPLIALVNNAGVTGKIGRLVDVSTQDLQRVVEINLMGTIFCSREAVRRMSTASGGSGGGIVNISSRGVQLGGTNTYVHYAAAKAAVETFTFGLAKEVIAEGIRVNCVSPGIIETEIHAAAGDPQRLQRVASEIPIQRVGRPDEVAAAVLWLLSEEASYCVGSILAVGGGR